MPPPLAAVLKRSRSPFKADPRSVGKDCISLKPLYFERNPFTLEQYPTPFDQNPGPFSCFRAALSAEHVANGHRVGFRRS